MLTSNTTRIDFPIFENNEVVFLDTAASAQKPLTVVEKMKEVYLHSYANVHRGTYSLSEESTLLYEDARKTVQKFINARSEKEIIFTKGATESINMVASTWARKHITKDDEVLISEAEHHANLIPWQNLRDEIGFVLRIFKINDDGSFNEKEFEKCLNNKTKLVAVTAMSNVLGNLFPIKKITKKAHEFGAVVLVDACQFAVHNQTDVLDMDCDFLVFSGHKIYGPTGIGVLYGKSELLEQMPPYQFGGDMVDKVTYEKTTYAKAPAKFEAGTPPFVEAVGLAEAIKYVENIGFDRISEHEKELSKYAIEQLSTIENLVFVGKKEEKHGVFAFIVEGIHSSDIAFILSRKNVCVRIGHHCAEPLVNRMGFTSIIRASIGIYSCKEDITELVSALKYAISFFGLRKSVEIQAHSG